MRILLSIVLLLAGCAVPPPDAYVSGGGRGRPEQAVDLGQNKVGESCVQSNGSGATADIYCGSWQQPSAHVRSSGKASEADLGALATTGGWRANLDSIYDCLAPQPVTLGGVQALQMACTRRTGGWPHVALVAVSGGQGWQADGVESALPAIQRSIAVLSGREKATVVASGAVDALQAQREGAKARATGDVRAFDSLMLQGARANLADDPLAAESAYGAALEVEQKALGKNNPNVADPEMHLALQFSNQGRFAEADAMFAHAGTLAVRQQGDPTLVARLKHYEGLNAYNQQKLGEALRLLREADAEYVAALPPDALRPKADTGKSGFNANLENVLETPAQKQAKAGIAGLEEVRRYQAVVLRDQGKQAESEAMIASAGEVARDGGLDRPELAARLNRTNAVTSSLGGKRDLALAQFTQSNQAFAQAYPGSRPLALIGLLRATELVQAGQPAAAIPICRSSIKVLVEIKSAFEPERMSGCLDAFAATAAAAKDTAIQQALLRDMFQAAQLVRGSTTSQQIQQASARLAASSGQSKVGEAIREQQDSAGRLADIRRRKEAIAQAVRDGAPPIDTKELDIQEEKAVADLASRESALQAAAPNYDQLIQQATSATDVLQALKPGEAFAAVTLTAGSGWTFILRDGLVKAGRIEGGAGVIDPLVTRVRKAMEPDLPAFDAEAAQILYADVFGTIPHGLDGVAALTVAPTGSLLSLPFAVLLTGPADTVHLAKAPWLVRAMSIGHVPSAGNFLALRRVATTSKATNPWFGFGDFRPVTLAQAQKSFPAVCGDSAELLARLPPLPSARQELEIARKLTGATAGDELLGPAFTASAVEKQDLSSVRVLHFATHAILPSDLKCEAEPALVTSAPAGAPDASGALLKASDLAQIKLDADVVILSACNSGGPEGKLGGGESLSTLARSFFYGGARSLLITHWEVSDQAATFIVADTLRRLRAEPGTDVAGALHETQLEVLDRAGASLPPEFAHPFYWAPFALIGQAGVSLPTAKVSAGL